MINKISVIVEKNKHLERTLSKAFLKHKKELYAFAISKVGNGQVCEDLVQNTYIKAWQYLVRGNEINSMRSFLYRIMNNLIIDEYRKNKNISLDQMIEEGFEPPNEEHHIIFKILDPKELVMLIRSLPRKYKSVVYMRFVQGIPIKIISKIINKSKNNITVRAYRGLHKLKVLYRAKFGNN